VRRWPLTLIALVLVLLVAVACNGDDDADGTATPSPTVEPTSTGTPTSTPTPTETPDGGGDFGIPEVTAISPGGAMVLGEGTYCWTGPNAPGLCVDKIGVITPLRSLVIAQGEAIELRGDLDWRGANALAVSVLPRPDEPVDSGPDWLAYRPEGASTGIGFELTADGIRFGLPVQPGDWLLTLSIAEERGDAMYGLLIHQIPSATGAFRTHLGLETEVDFGVEYLVEGTPYRIVFTAIEEDSRCPIDVTCIWAGQTRAIVEARNENGSVTPLGLTVPNGGEVTGVIDQTYQIRIIDVLPEPRSTVELEPADYRFVVVVERADAASAGTGVRGVVSVGPACPVLREGQWCPDHPLAAELIVRDTGGNEIERVESSEDGWFELELPPGSYELDPQTPSGSPFPIGQRVEFSVTSGGWTDLEVSYDSGIR
jgi:hypothetical protein